MAISSPQWHSLPQFLVPALSPTTTGLRSVRASLPAAQINAFAARNQHATSAQRSGLPTLRREISFSSPKSSRRRFRLMQPVQSAALLQTHAAGQRHPERFQQRTSILPHIRTFQTTRPRGRDHHFDTLKFVQRLKEEGFSEEQAVAMMKVLSDVIEESIQNLTRTMVLREDAEKATYTQKVDFAKLRSELLSSDSTESSMTRASHERLTNDLAKLNSRLRDEITRSQASVRLDLNLEKGRIREEANVQELKIKETETRIEQEVAGLRERVEGVKFSTLQWLM
ncbi:MAG: hypothetical protein M1837_006068 [Sclerophora amabilis]|nr:MAG: hypothetical protein M1837_006068 [Sclerophora amabilis]